MVLVLALILPDIIHYLVWQPDVLTLNYGRRHLINPLRTVANWVTVEASGWLAGPMLFALFGFGSLAGVMIRRPATQAGPALTATTSAEASDQQTRADIVG